MLPINESIFEEEFAKQLNTEIIATLDEQKSNEEYTIFTVKVKNRKIDKIQNFCDQNLEYKYKIEENKILLFNFISDSKLIDLLKLCRNLDSSNEIKIYATEESSLAISWESRQPYKSKPVKPIKPKNYDDIPF